MVNRSLAVLVVVLVVVACGDNSATTTQRPTASSVSLQPGDLPSGMRKCDLSGDIAAYMAKIKANSPANYAKRKTDWETAQKNGAIAEYIAFYTDSSAHCASIQSADVMSSSFKLAANYVVQFKDESSAVNGYTSGSMFGFTTDSLRGGGAPVLEGAKSGLGPNSIVLSVALGNTAYYLAVWQYKSFMVLLAILNTADVANGQNAALAEKGRIK